MSVKNWNTEKKNRGRNWEELKNIYPWTTEDDLQTKEDDLDITEDDKNLLFPFN